MTVPVPAVVASFGWVTSQFRMGQLATLILSAVVVSHAKRPYDTRSFRGFYNDRICGTVFTDRCRAHSKRIICGSNYCAELAPYHAVLDLKHRLGRSRRDGSQRVIDGNGPKQFLVKNKECLVTQLRKMRKSKN